MQWVMERWEQNTPNARAGASHFPVKVLETAPAKALDVVGRAFLRVQPEQVVLVNRSNFDVLATFLLTSFFAVRKRTCVWKR